MSDTGQNVASANTDHASTITSAQTHSTPVEAVEEHTVSAETCAQQDASTQAAAAPKPKLTERQKTLRALRRLIVKIVVVAAVVVFLLTVVGGVHVSHDNNMFPAVGDGDLAITYKLDPYYAGDVVVYEIDGKKQFGRVIGTPGDSIDISGDGYFRINGSVPYETIYFATKPADGSGVLYPYVVGEGELFIMNDLRENTYDSRTFSGVKAETVQGKVVLLLRRRGF